MDLNGNDGFSRISGTVVNAFCGLIAVLIEKIMRF